MREGRTNGASTIALHKVSAATRVKQGTRLLMAMRLACVSSALARLSVCTVAYCAAGISCTNETALDVSRMSRRAEKRVRSGEERHSSYGFQGAMALKAGMHAASRAYLALQFIVAPCFDERAKHSVVHDIFDIQSKPPFAPSLFEDFLVEQRHL